MRLEVTPKEPWHIRIKDNGKVVLDKVLEAGVARYKFCGLGTCWAAWFRNCLWTRIWNSCLARPGFWPA